MPENLTGAAPMARLRLEAAGIRPAVPGILTARVRRGPWGHILDMPEVDEHCLFHLSGLAELPARVAAHNADNS